MMRFADYFGRAFASVSGSQFPWVKLFRESTVAKIADVSLELFLLLIRYINVIMEMRNLGTKDCFFLLCDENGVLM